MKSQATTVKDYLAELPADRRPAIEAVRDVILENLPPGYEEGMQYGMIGYFVPHSIYPPGYHCDPSQPLPYVCLASQKNYMSLYMACVYGGPHADWFRKAWAKSGKKLDMGKSCIRFKKTDDLPLDVIGEAIARVPVQDLIVIYRKVLERTPTKRSEITARTKAAANVKAAKSRGAIKQSAVKKSSAKKPTATTKGVKKKSVPRKRT